MPRAADGEDLRRLGLVPLRHAGFDRARHPHRKVHVGQLDPGQAEARRLRLPAQLRRGDLQGYRRDLRRQRATTSISPVPPASTSRAPNSLCHPSEDEALEIIAALTQLYREQGRYLERIYKWAKRVGDGVDPGRQIVATGEAPLLLRALRLSQKFAQVDPWSGARQRQGRARIRCPWPRFGMPEAAE
jgi:hypothetical protein